ncbi:penicillin acylase family protein [Trinickia violacea]|uniref:Penicillin acylase family protein n=1 Tax=Trinickia violacea TaxID=2571746 RepID=A0A4P8IP21_9BURK|nr:penicillin acylase family protein [Trinickia violacea]QCP49667.1 penicillin acylase family protein [Trinickia violacea]
MLLRTEARRSSFRITRITRIAGIGVAAILLILIVCAAGIWLFLRASLPQLDGTRAEAGLSEPVTISRDAQGVVTIRGATRADVAFATGFAQAQDRFFQMDLLRRVAAGELAALIGGDALAIDEQNRLNRFRSRAEIAVAALPADERALLGRYTAGVNAGLASLSARPFEYAMLRAAPQPWRPADTLLVVYAMYLDLQAGEVPHILARAALRDAMPPDLFAFLTPSGSRWDAPLDGQPTVAGPPVIPATRPDWLDDKSPTATTAHAEAFIPPSAAIGSNNWAVDAAHGVGGRALVANDMHLGLRLPNIWYRLTLYFPDETDPTRGRTRRLSGVSLPGTPLVVAGSNGDVAWGFTNSYGHFIDLVEIERDPADPLRYRGPGGEWERADEHVETIAVKGAPSVQLPVRETRWGPMLEVDADKGSTTRGHAARTYAVRWAAYLPGAVNVNLIRMEQARDVRQALAAGQESGIPTQNLVVADRGGHIAWTLAGPLPDAMFDSQGLPVPAGATSAASRFERLPAANTPHVIDPPQGRLWTANNTQLGDVHEQHKIGDSGADMGARATQIRDDLFARERFDERDLLAIQLDDRALWVRYWRELALDTLDEDALRDHPQRAAFKRIVSAWNGRADSDAAGYTLVRDFYQSFYEAWFGPLDARMQQRWPKSSQAKGVMPWLSSPTAGRASSRLEPVMEALAQQHAWVPSRDTNWRAFVLDRIDATIARNVRHHATLDDASWGERNRLALYHPFARLLPESVRGWLGAPADPMPGDIDMPRVQHPSFGASERFAVSPGHEEDGILEMPGGASGHPLSPYFLAGHRAWERGEPSPFLPGPDVHRLTLTPLR